MAGPSGNLLIPRSGKDENNASVVLYPQGGRSVGGKLKYIVHCELINTILLGIHTTQLVFNVFDCSAVAINA